MPASVAALLRTGTGSAADNVVLSIRRDRLCIRGDNVVRQFDLAECAVAPRIANIPRVITLPDGGLLEVADNDGLDALLGRAGLQPVVWIHQLESRLSYVTLAVLVAVLLVALLFKAGVPLLAKTVATQLPDAVQQRMGDAVLKGLQSHPLFAASRLADARRAELERRFAPLVAEHHLKIYFHAAPAIGANAFALPGGHVIFTDQLVALAANDIELVAVLAHEAGHVRGNHSTRSILASSISALLLTAFLGDASALAGVIIAAPTLLLNAAYSRDFEREADDYAIDWMLRNELDPRQLGDILQRMSRQSAGADGGFLSTHPATAARRRAMRAALNPDHQ